MIDTKKDMGLMTNNIFISYREGGAKASCFLNVRDVLNSYDIDRISSVYNSILLSINSFDPSKIDEIKRVESMFFKRLIILINHRDRSLVNTLKSVFTFGIYSRVQSGKYNRRIRDVLEIHDSFLHYTSEISKSLWPKKRGLPLKELEELNRIRLEDSLDELVRLAKMPRIKNSLEKIRDTSHELTVDQLVAIARSIELRENLKRGYYVINHGQNIEMMLVNVLATKLKNIFEPRQHENYQVLRHDVYLKECVEGVDWYRRTLRNDSDHNHRRAILSGDCCLESTSRNESAIDFFSRSTNVALRYNQNFIRNIIDGILFNYFPDSRIRNKLSGEIIKLVQELGEGGTLYSICIPKERFQEVGFLSEPYGKPYKYQSIEHLEMLQEGLNYEPDSTKIWAEPDYETLGVPQVRLLTHKLKPKDGILIVPNSTLSQEKIDSIERDIDLLIQKAQMQFRIK